MPIPAVAFAGGIFVIALYKTTETIWGKAFDAAWTPVDEALKERFARWAGTDKESQRRTAFEQAAGRAYELTTRQAADPQEAERVLAALNGKQDPGGAKALAEEAAKLMLFSASPDVPRLTRLCQERLHWEALWAGETAQAIPKTEDVAAVLSNFLSNLREALLDQEPYHDLVQREMLRALRQVVAELRPVAYDDEDTYRAQLAAMVRELEFVGIPELKERRPITVEDIFIHLRAEREIEVEESRYFQSEQDVEIDGTAEAAAVDSLLSAEFRRSVVTGPRKHITERVSITEALQEAKRLTVLGDPGSGKTTLLKYLTVICAEGRAEAELGLRGDGGEPLLPIFIPLREFAAECAGRDQDYCLLDYFYTHAREHLLLHLPRGFFETALETGRCLVCLDGLDEVWAVGGRKRVRDAVKALAARFPRGRYLVTSRIVGYEKAPLGGRDFIHHSVLPLSDEDIREFVRKWYATRERDPARRKGQIDDLTTTIEREPRIQSLARNPLLLTIITLVHRIEAELPHERVKLYDKCITALVDTWEEVKGLSIEEKKRPFYRYRRRLLERLAYELHTQAEQPGQVQMVKEGDLEITLTRFLMENRRLGFADDPDGARDEARAFIWLARGRTGLLVERGEGVFGFPHLTFQEYLAACDIENRCIHHGVDAMWEEIKEHLHDSHWQEMILLLLGGLNKYDEPPTLLVERVLEAGETDKYEPILHRHLYLAACALADRVDVADDLHQTVVTRLVEIARTAPAWERGDAFSGLSQMVGDGYASEGLLALARDERVDDWVRSTAADALGQLGRAKEAAEILLALARDERVDDGVRSDAAAALGQLGRAEEATEILLALARDERVDDWAPLLTAATLGQLGRAEEAAKILLALAHDEGVDKWVRRTAADVLGQLSRLEENVLEGLLALARDEQVDDWVRRAAAAALGQLGRAEEAAKILLALARDERGDDWVRHDAANALGQLGRAGDNVLEDLLALARDERVSGVVRSAAADALGQLGRAEEATEILLALAHDERGDDWVRRDAANALGQLDRAEEAAEILLALARDERVDDRVRSDAAAALGQLGHAEEATKTLLALARDERVDDRVRSDAANALGQLDRAEEAAEILLALARDERVDDWVRHDAATALGQLGRAEENVLEGLLALARDERGDDWVRRDAYEILKQLVGMVD